MRMISANMHVRVLAHLHKRACLPVTHRYVCRPCARGVHRQVKATRRSQYTARGKECRQTGRLPVCTSHTHARARTHTQTRVSSVCVWSVTVYVRLLFDCMLNHKSLQFEMEILIKCADTSNVLKPFPIAKKWAMRVTDEFFLQVGLSQAVCLGCVRACVRVCLCVCVCVCVQ